MWYLSFCAWLTLCNIMSSSLSLFFFFTANSVAVKATQNILLDMLKISLVCPRSGSMYSALGEAGASGCCAHRVIIMCQASATVFSVGWEMGGLEGLLPEDG